MKAWFVALPIALAIPAAVGAQEAEADDARVAEFQCQLAGICGELAEAEAGREQQVIDGVESRAMMTVGEALARKNGTRQQPGAKKMAPVARAEAPASAQVVRKAARTVASPGRRAPAPVVKKMASTGGAVDVPESLARRAPLFVTFGLNSAKLTQESAVEVASFAKFLKSDIAASTGKRYRIEGHTDSTGDAALNRKLSEERAASVRAALLAAGVDGTRIEVAGFGSDQPIEGLKKSDALNRRVEAVEIK